MIGAITDMEYESASTTLDSFAKIYVVSDGAYEIEKADQTMWPFSEFLTFMGQGPHDDATTSKMDLLIAHDRELMGQRRFRGRSLDGGAGVLSPCLSSCTCSRRAMPVRRPKVSVSRSGRLEKTIHGILDLVTSDRRPGRGGRRDWKRRRRFWGCNRPVRSPGMPTCSRSCCRR